ncbi:hypothetical protein DCF38_10935 [Edwardsiella piscicida]|uniref:hypothetical protein n=1 Tax=Edwardsiella piscicida TaxID=1263550 RepID=UPI001056F240|nr:hypothetical protein [Edwardsiella piscicida]UCQ40051.1 hypothetical protein DCF38_10935 [Edwardsiella piscicida]
MNLTNLKEALKPTREPLVLTPSVTVYIQLPSIGELMDCDSDIKTILHCVVDENGQRIFSTENDVNDIDLAYQIKMSTAIRDLMSKTMDAEKIEKK